MVQWFQRSFSFVSAKRIVPFDETNHIFISERYYGGHRARNYMDMELYRPGGAHTGVNNIQQVSMDQHSILKLYLLAICLTAVIMGM